MSRGSSDHLTKRHTHTRTHTHSLSIAKRLIDRDRDFGVVRTLFRASQKAWVSGLDTLGNSFSVIIAG